MASEESWRRAAFSGTPLVDEYRAHTSAIYERLPAIAFDPSPYPAEAVERARRWWVATTRSEYESSTTFIDLAARLREIAAPIDVQATALRMAGDELRHAEIAAEVAVAMGADAPFPTAPPMPGPHPDCSGEEAVLRVAIFGCCIAETVNAARLAQQMGQVRDPLVRAATRLLLADERLHAQFGFYYLEHRRAFLDARPELKVSLTRYLRYAFAFLERYMGAVPADARPLEDGERALGLPDFADRSTSFQEVVLNACIPGLERFGLDATTAWRERALTPPATHT